LPLSIFYHEFQKSQEKSGEFLRFLCQRKAFIRAVFTGWVIILENGEENVNFLFIFPLCLDLLTFFNYNGNSKHNLIKERVDVQ